MPPRGKSDHARKNSRRGVVLRPFESMDELASCLMIGMKGAPPQSRDTLLRTTGPLKAKWHRLGGCGGLGAQMPSDPHQCRIFAARCLALAKRASRPEARQVFTDMAETSLLSPKMRSQSLLEISLKPTRKRSSCSSVFSFFFFFFFFFFGVAVGVAVAVVSSVIFMSFPTNGHYGVGGPESCKASDISTTALYCDVSSRNAAKCGRIGLRLAVTMRLKEVNELRLNPILFRQSVTLDPTLLVIGINAVVVNGMIGVPWRTLLPWASAQATEDWIWGKGRARNQHGVFASTPSSACQ